MAADTIQLRVRAGQGKAGLGVQRNALDILKDGRVMTVYACAGKVALVNVHVASRAITYSSMWFVELEVDMT